MPTVAVVSMKGGVGKTSIVLGLASAAWQRQDRCLVVDLDPQANATAALDVLAPGLTTSDVLADGRPGVAAQAVMPTGWGGSVRLIAAEPALEHRQIPAGPGSALRLRTTLASLPRSYDLVLIDTPPSLGELTRNALSTADIALVVTEPGYFALRGAAQAATAVDVIREATNPRLRLGGIVVNRRRSGLHEHDARIAELRAQFGVAVSSRVIPDDPVVAQVQGAGIPLHAWSSPTAREIQAIFDALLDDICEPTAEHRSKGTEAHDG